jgi:hypothetical protein
LSQASKILLLIVSFLPVLVAQIFAFLLLSQPAGRHPGLEANVGYLVLSLAAFQFVLAAFFIWHLRNHSTVPPEQRVNWILQFLFLPTPFGVTGYWYKHIWRANGRAR